VRKPTDSQRGSAGLGGYAPHVFFMKAALTLLALFAATPAAAQSWLQPYEAQRREAELRRWGATADAQAAYSANDQARTDQNLRQLQRQTLPPLERPSTVIEDQAAAAQRQSAWRAEDRATEAGRQVQEIDRWLYRGASNPPQR
jgi:hypothetical protein